MENPATEYKTRTRRLLLLTVPSPHLGATMQLPGAAASQVGEDAWALFVGWGSPGLAKRRVGRPGPVFTLPSAKSQHRGAGKGPLNLCLGSL